MNKVIEIKGNALLNDCDVLCHQVNLAGVMGAGIAASIADEYPNVEKEYAEYPNKNVGEVCFANADNYVVANCFSQNHDFTTNYKALEECVNKVNQYMNEHCLKSVAIPYYYGCGIASGDWETVKNIFINGLVNKKLKIYKL